jgi:diacylglycerol kinase
MTSQRERQRTSWFAKFAAAARGMLLACLQERSFHVHLPVALGVIAAGFWLRVSTVEWGLLLLCIGGVGTAELLNTAVERLAAIVEPEDNPAMRDVLDIASGAVLWFVMVAVVIGGVIFAAAYGRLMNGT